MKKICCVLLGSICLAGSVFAGGILEAAGSEFIDAVGGKTETAPSAKIVGFYFSAHWCPPCRAFTPKLVEFYSDLKQDGKEFEIIFVSSDKGEDEMMAYMNETSMPWLAVPYGSAARDALKKITKEELGLNYIPVLVIVRDGQVIAKNGRGDVEASGSKAYQKWLTLKTEAAEKTAESANEKAVEKKPAASSISAIPAPEKKEIKFTELKAQMVDLDGKVVKTGINYVSNFEQSEKGKYRAWCGVSGNGSYSSEWVTIPEGGKEFFQELDKQNHYGGGHKTVYMRVRGQGLEAVGIRYRKDKDEYGW